MACFLLLGTLAACGGAPDHPRRVDVGGTENFRDVGGYTISKAKGTKVRKGVLYRSDNLDSLKEADFETLAALGVKRVYDLRDAHEKTGATAAEAEAWKKEAQRYRDPMNPPPPSPVSAAPTQESRIQVVNLPIYYPPLDRRESRRKILSADVEPGHFEALMVEANRAMALNYREEWAELLRSLADAEQTPAVVHCVEGKDRTGFAIALVLSAIGVPRETVYADYVLSTKLLESRIDRYAFYATMGSAFRLSKAQVLPLLEVRREYLEAAFDAIEEKYGTLDNYLRDGLGLDEATLARLRETLTEPS